MQYNVGYNLDPNTFVWIKSAGYNFKNFVTPIDFLNTKMNLRVLRASDCSLTMMMILLILIYTCFIFLADHLVESNRGHRKNPFKFVLWLKNKIWKREEPSDSNEPEVTFKPNGESRLRL